MLSLPGQGMALNYKNPLSPSPSPSPPPLPKTVWARKFTMLLALSGYFCRLRGIYPWCKKHHALCFPFQRAKVLLKSLFGKQIGAKRVQR